MPAMCAKQTKVCQVLHGIVGGNLRQICGFFLNKEMREFNRL